MPQLPLDNNKYTIIYGEGERFRALRYGEEWRDLTGDNLVLALCYLVEDLTCKILSQEGIIEEYADKMRKLLK